MRACFAASSAMAPSPWRHFRSGIAPQRAEAAAGRVHQHAVELAGEALRAHVALARQHDRMHVGDARARRARRELAQALLRHVHRVDAAGAVHQHRQRERLAARAGAEVRDHLAAPRREQVGEQLAAFVLHFERAVEEQRVAVDLRLALEADAGGRIAASAPPPVPGARAPPRARASPGSRAGRAAPD